MSAPRQRDPSIFGMVVAGIQITARHRRLVIALYLVQLFASLLFLVAAQQILASAFDHRPLFGQGIGGDTEALLLSLSARPGVGAAVAVTGMTMVFGYAMLSLFLNAGLIGVFAGRTFGEAASRWFMPYLRLWGWSLIPYALCVIVVAIGVKIAGGGDAFERMISWNLLVWRPLWFAVPGLALLAITLCAVDYARADLVVGDRYRAVRALIGGFRFVLKNPMTLAHYGLYLVFWVAVSGLYLLATFGHPFAGAGGALVLLALRQVVSIARFGARVATTGGQVALVLQTTARQ